ncbi:poly [ADP-ribose] polymerase isoform X2 [Cephus cinctus]|nr:poly [ADP-ribose] polymerase isoform X2 [Cephus cinctus]
MRISRKDFESEDARQYGGIDRWYHLECFAKLRDELQFFVSGNTLPGTDSLSKEDQGTLIKTLPKIKGENIPPSVKKIKNEPDDEEEEKLLKEQNVKIFKMRDELSKLNKDNLIMLLQENHQGIPEGISNMLDNLSDMMVFGSLKPCSKCKGQLVYQYGVGYKCTGNVTEWAACDYVTTEPARTKVKIPAHLKNDNPFFKKYKNKISKRFMKVIVPSTSEAVKKEETDSGPKVEAKPRPLKNMSFVLSGNLKTDKKSLTREISLLGGTVVTKIHENLAAVISTPEEVAKMDKKMEKIKALDIQVVSEDFVTEAKDYTTAPIMLINKKNISSWGGDPASRIPQNVEKSKSSGKSRYEKSSSGKVKLRVKGGGAVDPESGLEDQAHVYQRKNENFTVTLGITDIQSKKNSYYKLQILKHDAQNKYWLFRNWGRIGTTIGGKKLEVLPLDKCIDTFKNLYFEKTDNLWEDRNNFQKKPKKMYPIDMDHGLEDDDKNLLDSNIKSNLKQPVQDLLRLIFDVNLMKKVMREFEIDSEKMPLGKLSKKQIEKAYSVLTELQTLIKSGNPERLKLIDASNQFYTLIPHDFGVSEPIILDTEGEILTKTQMLESLLEIEIAYNLLHTKTDESKNPLDAHYEQLNTDIDVLDKSSEEFKIIQEYVKNTHAATHTQYNLEVEDVFVIKRHGEDQRFKPFKKLHNRKLLWHGSRTTNFAGILSQGLRIAPPEAPVTGYMFGKGIYFADMVSKSANYCCTDRNNPTGLMLLCEVALGNMYERHESDYIEKLPKGKHSTLGLGQTQPDPTKVYKTKDGVVIPYGPGIPVKREKKSHLLYNEYIVYDVAQVKAKYLLKMKFKYNV